METEPGTERNGSGSRIIILFESQPFEHHQQSVYVPRIKLTLTENIRLLTLFNNHHHHHHHTAAWAPKRQGQGNNSIWRHTCAPFVSALVHSRFESTMSTLILRKTKMVNALKKNPNKAIPQTTTLQCLTFGFHFIPLRKKSNLF